MKPLARMVVLVLAITAAIILPTTPESNANAPTLGEFVQTACAVPLPEGANDGSDIICGYVSAPEYHDQMTVGTVRLAVAILPALQPDPAPDPLFMEQGGPGGSTLHYFVQALLNTELGDILRNDRDIVLVEQRGTLYAEPFLGCDELTTLTYEQLNAVQSPTENQAQELDALKACQARLRGDGVDLSAFDSLQNAGDINLVREALGYETINLYGVSYGTMLVQHYMREYPDTLRTAIVDAVVPLSHNFITEYPANAQRAFDGIFAACRREDACRDTFPELETRFYQTVERLNTTPEGVRIYDETNDAVYDDVFTGNDLMLLVFRMMYSTELLPFLPQIMTLAAENDFEVIQALQGFYTFNFTTARGMYYSVLCAEDADFTEDDVMLDDVRPVVAAHFNVDRWPHVCGLWAVDDLGPSMDVPVQSDIPTLVMSGEFDPITPPINGKILGQTLPNAYVYTFPGVGHGSFSVPCGTFIMLQFLDNPTDTPNSTCVSEMGIEFSTGS